MGRKKPKNSKRMMTLLHLVTSPQRERVEREAHQRMLRNSNKMMKRDQHQRRVERVARSQEAPNLNPKNSNKRMTKPLLKANLKDLPRKISIRKILMVRSQSVKEAKA